MGWTQRDVTRLRKRYDERLAAKDEIIEQLRKDLDAEIEVRKGVVRAYSAADEENKRLRAALDRYKRASGPRINMA
jgi:hypothetical protein